MAEVYSSNFIDRLFLFFIQIQGNIKVLTNERDNLSILYEQVCLVLFNILSEYSYVRQKKNYKKLVMIFYKTLKHRKYH
jgi:hypothetical protein